MKQIIISICMTVCFADDLVKSLQITPGINSQIKEAIKRVPKNQYDGMKWLIENMPREDLNKISSEFLLSTCQLAYDTRGNTPWGKKIPDELFFTYVLPYANLNEQIEDWREDFNNRFYPMVKDAKSAYEAVVVLNHKIFDELGVIYSTNRPKADQSPYESIKAGMASCTGLSILLIAACRSVGIPARFVGTPLWYNDSGNHSWVEIWDGEWYFTGAAEPTGQKLNESWFQESASKAQYGSKKYGIFAATWDDTGIFFPMDWLPNVNEYNAIDVTHNYKIEFSNSELVPVRVRAIDSYGIRKEVKVEVFGEDSFFKEGVSKGESFDANDHLTFMLPAGKIFTLKSKNIIKSVQVAEEIIIDLEL